jgi:chemotaxis protein methyltransferase CheR
MAGLQLRASDVNRDYLKRAQAGTYPSSSLKEVPEKWRDRYFKKTKRGQGYQVAEHLKEGIIWKEENLLSGPPETGFQVIFLRNSLLTYYGEVVKVPAFQAIVHGLAKGGFLIIGAHEKMPPQAEGLLTPRGDPLLFQKKGP